MRAPSPPSRVPRLVAGAVVLAAALAPTAGADVLVTRTGDGTGTARPILVAPDGTRRELAAVPLDGGGMAPVVSPDRTLVGFGGPEKATVLPTSGAPTLAIAPDVGTASAGDAIWWSPKGFVSAVGLLGNPGPIATCAVPSGPCKETKAPGGDLVGVLGSGASVWQLAGTYLLPQGLESAYQEWVTATPAQVRRVRLGVRRPLLQRLVLRSPDGKDRVLSTVRRSPAAGTQTFSPIVERGSLVVATRDTSRTTMKTRTRRGRLQIKLDERTSSTVLRAFSESGRSRAFRFRSPSGTDVTGDASPTAVPGGWLVALLGKDDASTRGIGRLAPDGRVQRVTAGGVPLTVTSLSAALGLPKPESGPRGGDISGLRPVGYEAATDSDVVAFDIPADSRQVFARIPRSGAAPSLVIAGQPHQEVRGIAW